jgi:hypothetical protein
MIMDDSASPGFDSRPMHFVHHLVRTPILLLHGGRCNHSRLLHGIHYCFEPDDGSWIRSELRSGSFCNNLNSIHVLPVVSRTMLHLRPRHPTAVTGLRTGCSSIWGLMEHDSLLILCSVLRARSLPTTRRIGQYSMPWCTLERDLRSVSGIHLAASKAVLVYRPE